MYCITFCVILCNIEMFFLHYTGPIGAAAPRAHPRVPPGEYSVIVLVRLVLLVFVNSPIVFARCKNRSLIIIFISPQVPMPLLFLCVVVVVVVVVDVVEEHRQEGVALGLEGHVVVVRYVELQCLCYMNHMMMQIKGIHRCYCVVPENIHTPPPHGRDFSYDPLPSGFSKN